MRNETDQFVCFRDLVYAELCSNGAICINLESSDHINYTYMTKQQAKQFANQLLEMCEEKTTQPENATNLNGIYVNKVGK